MIECMNTVLFIVQNGWHYNMHFFPFQQTSQWKVNDKEIVILKNDMFGECNNPCTLKTSFIDFEKE
jgi:hypothetical protein